MFQDSSWCSDESLSLKCIWGEGYGQLRTSHHHIIIYVASAPVWPVWLLVCFQCVTCRMWCSRVILDLLAFVSVSLSRVLILKPSAFPVWVPWHDNITQWLMISQNSMWHHRHWHTYGQVSKELKDDDVIDCQVTSNIMWLVSINQVARRCCCCRCSHCTLFTSPNVCVDLK